MGILIRQDKPGNGLLGHHFWKSFSNLACALTHDDKMWEKFFFFVRVLVLETEVVMHLGTTSR